MANWNGTAWSIQAGPAPGQFFSEAPNGVSCTAAAACEAVSGGALSYNGQTWSGQTVPVPTSNALQGAALSGDSCTAAYTCLGVGTSTANDGNPPQLLGAGRPDPLRGQGRGRGLVSDAPLVRARRVRQDRGPQSLARRDLLLRTGVSAGPQSPAPTAGARSD